MTPQSALPRAMTIGLEAVGTYGQQPDHPVRALIRSVRRTTSTRLPITPQLEAFDIRPLQYVLGGPHSLHLASMCSEDHLTTGSWTLDLRPFIT